MAALGIDLDQFAPSRGFDPALVHPVIGDDYGSSRKKLCATAQAPGVIMASFRRAENPAGKSHAYGVRRRLRTAAVANRDSAHAAEPGDQGSLGTALPRTLPIERRVYPAGQELYAQGEPNANVYFVSDGWAVRYKLLEDGRRQILDFALPGAILGFGPAPDAAVGHTAESLTDLTVAVLPYHQLRELLAHHNALAMWFVETLGGQVESAYESLTDAGRRTAHEAIAHLLLRLARRALAGRPFREGMVLDLPLKLEHIADALGLTAEHVCRILRQLREGGVVTHRKGHLRVDDPSRLVAAAGVLAEDARSSRWRAA